MRHTYASDAVRKARARESEREKEKERKTSNNRSLLLESLLLSFGAGRESVSASVFCAADALS